MRAFRHALPLLAVATFAISAPAQTLGSPLPELEAVRWYNTPPLHMQDLRGKAVLFEVFRTW